VWAETRMRSPGSRRRVVAVSTRQGESGREAEKEKEKGGRTTPNFIGPAAQGEGPCRIETSSPESGGLAPTPHMAQQLWPETASLSFWKGHPRQREYSAPTPRDDMNRPHRKWHANRPAKAPGPGPGNRPRVPHARSGARPAPINAPAPRANVARTVHSPARSRLCWP